MAVPPVRNARERAEKACQLAEELFLAGNIDNAHRQAKRAKLLCPTLPGVDNALATYEVHIRAAEAKREGACIWRAVLNIGPGAAAADVTTQDAVKMQFRRLSLLVHPDKTHCAAAEGAFRLLWEAHDKALSLPAPPPSTSRSGPADWDTRTAPTPVQEPPVHEPHKPILIYCPSCENEFCGKVGRLERRDGMRCARCPAWLNWPWQTKLPTKKKPPAAPGRQVFQFQCSARCPGCRERYTSMVCVGRWCLQCKACSKAAMVDVHGPDDATASITRRA